MLHSLIILLSFLAFAESQPEQLAAPSWEQVTAAWKAEAESGRADGVSFQVRSALPPENYKVTCSFGDGKRFACVIGDDPATCTYACIFNKEYYFEIATREASRYLKRIAPLSGEGSELAKPFPGLQEIKGYSRGGVLRFLMFRETKIPFHSLGEFGDMLEITKSGQRDDDRYFFEFKLDRAACLASEPKFNAPHMLAAYDVTHGSCVVSKRLGWLPLEMELVAARPASEITEEDLAGILRSGQKMPDGSTPDRSIVGSYPAFRQALKATYVYGSDNELIECTFSITNDEKLTGETHISEIEYLNSVPSSMFDISSYGFPVPEEFATGKGWFWTWLAIGSAVIFVSAIFLRRRIGKT